MFEKIKNIWNKYRFEIILGISVIIILILALIRMGHKGTYSKFFHYDTKNHSNIKKSYSSQQNTTKKRESAGEKECRRVLQKIFKKPFPSIRPNFLKNTVINSGKNLELDCYNHQLKLGAEYDGRQHHVNTPHWHETKADFQNQQYRDFVKDVKCKENGVFTTKRVFGFLLALGVGFCVGYYAFYVVNLGDGMNAFLCVPALARSRAAAGLGTRCGNDIPVDL